MNFFRNVFILFVFLCFSSEAFASGDALFGIDSCKLCKKVVRATQFPILKSKIHFSPIVAWNNYDKTQLGIAFYSKPKLKNINFVFAPMIGTGSLNLTGIANFSYTFPLEKIKSLEFGFKSKRFSYALFPEDLAYNKVEPFVELTFKPSSNEKMKSHRQTLNFRSSLIFLEYLSKGRQTSFYYVNDLSYNYDFKKEKDNIWFQINAKQSTNFASISAEANFQFNFNTKRKNAVYLRVFGGGFLYSTFNGESPIAKFQMSGSTNNFRPEFQKDFQFDQFYFDRNAQDPFFSKQVAFVDGAFRSVTDIGNSNKYLFALNLKTDIPFPIPIEPWANVALLENANKPEIAAEIGASLNLFNGFMQFHFPFITTKNISANQQFLGIDNFGKRITFSLDLMKLDKLREL